MKTCSRVLNAIEVKGLSIIMLGKVYCLFIVCRCSFKILIELTKFVLHIWTTTLK